MSVKFKIESVHISVRRDEDGLMIIGACQCGARASGSIENDALEGCDFDDAWRMTVGVARALTSIVRRRCRCWQNSTSSVQAALELARLAARRVGVAHAAMGGKR